jgi:hypothetical protein
MSSHNGRSTTYNFIPLCSQQQLSGCVRVSVSVSVNQRM